MSKVSVCLKDFNKTLLKTGVGGFKIIRQASTAEVPPKIKNFALYSKNLIEGIHEMAVWVSQRNGASFEISVSGHVKVRFADV